MDDLISRKAAINAIQNTVELFVIVEPGTTCIIGAGIKEADVIKALSALPSAQPERKTGVWEISDAYPHNVYCSVCHKRFAQTHWLVWQDGSLPRKYCPNCGAKMERG